MRHVAIHIALVIAGIYELWFASYTLWIEGTAGLNHPKLATAGAIVLGIAGIWMLGRATIGWAATRRYLDRVLARPSIKAPS